MNDRTRKLLEQFGSFVHQERTPLALAISAALIALSYITALALRLDLEIARYLTLASLTLPLSLLLFFRLAAYAYWGLNQSSWRHASTRDLETLIKAHLLSSICFTAAVGFMRVPDVPRSVILIELALSILFCGGGRLLARRFFEGLGSFAVHANGAPGRDVVILGAGDTGHLLVKNLISESKLGYRPVVVLDDSVHRIGTLVHGIKVSGALSDLEEVLDSRPAVSAVILAIPGISEAKFRQIKAICGRRHIMLKRVQAFEDLACYDAHAFEAGPAIETLLEKEVRVEFESEIRRELCGKRVLVTGAGGSIGSELVYQIMPFGPQSVIMLDHSEFNLFQVDRRAGERFPAQARRAVLGSICDEERLLNVLNQFRPQLVFHAAAYKHVPLIESNPHEAFKNNVLGTRTLIRACHLTGVERFVLISTDKAIEPVCTMGRSKRIAEFLVQEYAASQPDGMSTAVVRFGNVINSAGSVLPIFKEQILSGGPVTVTHPEMERFFMSIREAVRLVLTAGTLGRSGEIYVLDMGAPIKIMDVAKKMLSLYGRRDIPLVFTGLRPGEKLSERLVSRWENTAATPFNKVSLVRSSFSNAQGASAWAAELGAEAGALSQAEIAERMAEYVELHRRPYEGQAVGA